MMLRDGQRDRKGYTKRRALNRIHINKPVHFIPF